MVNYHESFIDIRSYYTYTNDANAKNRGTDRMNFFGKPEGRKYHTRTKEVSVYEYDEQRFVVEGCLTDRRPHAYYSAAAGKQPPGILHQMIVHLLVDKATLEIENLHVKMPVIPDKACLEMINSIESVKGLRIARGFVSKIKMLAGHGKGCTHLIELLMEMASSSIQGRIAYKQDQAPIPTTEIINMMSGTCWTWRAEGPLIDSLKEQTE
jgi:hypothetical protein